MFFPILNTLKTSLQIDNFVISKLDVWLATRRYAIRKFLDPIQFSIDTGIDEDFSITLFAQCTNPSISVLKQRYVVECPQCNRILKTYTKSNKIEHLIYCGECNRNIKITLDDIIIWFELIETPVKSLTRDNSFQKQSIDAQGKGYGLRASRIDNSDIARRLFSGYDERIRSS